MNEHRPAYAWLVDLQKAKVDGLRGTRSKIAISDLLDRVNDPNALPRTVVPTSPRSVEACLRLGIDPIELVHRPLNYFLGNDKDRKLARIKYDHYEALRQERVKLLQNERQLLVDMDEPQKKRSMPAAMPREKGGGDIVEKERQRLEVLKRRQERELNQIITHETQRQQLLETQQKKLDAMEQRAKELEARKAQQDAEWKAHQRDRELIKLKEEEAREREAKRMAQERFRREQEQQRLERLEAKRRRQEAYEKEIERREKAEQARRETERILQEQHEEIRRRKAEMERRDRERELRIRHEKSARAEANMEKRQRAGERISAALSKDRDIQKRKQDDYRRREASNEERRRLMDEMRLKEETRKREVLRKREDDRQAKHTLALAKEEERKMEIRRKGEIKDRILTDMRERQEEENALRRVQRQLYASLRLDKVDAMQKMQTYGRQQLFERIMGENERIAALLAKRTELQKKQKMVNMQASMQRQEMNQLMQKLKTSKNLDAIRGGVDLQQISRPQTR